MISLASDYLRKLFFPLWLALGWSVIGPNVGLAAPGDVKWTFQTDGMFVDVVPAIGADGTVYITTRPPQLDPAKQPKLYALDGGNGTKKWEAATASLWSPVIGPTGSVYVGSWDGVRALDRATGRLLWQRPDTTSAPAVSADGKVYVAAFPGLIVPLVWALDGATGATIWETTLSDRVWSVPAIGSDGTVYVGSSAGKLYALDGGTGRMKWEVAIWQNVMAPVVGRSNTVYTVADDGILRAFDGATGQPKWTSKVGHFVSPPVVGALGFLYLVGAGAYGLDEATGAQRWILSTPSAVGLAPAVSADGTVYFPSYDGNLYALDGATGAKEWHRSFSFPTVTYGVTIGTDGTVYFGTSDGKVYALEGNSSSGLADSPWPTPGGNDRNTHQGPSQPFILQPLRSGVLLEGTPANLVVEARGEPPPVFQWFFNGQTLFGATNPVHSIASVSSNDAGAYMLVASNGSGSVTNGPIVLGVNNVVLSKPVVGLVLTTPPVTNVEIQVANTLPGPWTHLTTVTPDTSPSIFIDTSTTNSFSRRFYRTTYSAPLQAWALPNWTISKGAGSRLRIEYVNAQTGFTNWQFVTNLTLPFSPYQFIDTTATNKSPRYYRTTPIQ